MPTHDAFVASLTELSVARLLTISTDSSLGLTVAGRQAGHWLFQAALEQWHRTLDAHHDATGHDDCRCQL